MSQARRRRAESSSGTDAMRELAPSYDAGRTVGDVGDGHADAVGELDVEGVGAGPAAVDPLLARANRALAGIRRAALGDRGLVDDRSLARLETIEAIAEAVVRVSDGSPEGGDTDMDAEGAGPTVGEVKGAIRTLLASATASRRSQWEHAVDALVACPALDADQLYQAYRHAERKRRLLATVPLLGAAEVARLMPDRVDTDRNTARVLARLRKEGDVLAVRVKRDWKYPAGQFDARGEVRAPLPALLRRAVACGYDQWEILHWLATPVAAPAEVTPGRPLEDLGPDASLEDVARLAAARHEGDVPEAGVEASPFELLERDDDAAFEQAARRWLED